MRISFSPQRRDESLSVIRLGDGLKINEVMLSFDDLEDGQTLPMAAVPSPFIAGDITRADGVLHVPLILPINDEASEEKRFPADIVDPPAGPIILPGDTAAVEDNGMPVDGKIDWDQVMDEGGTEPVPGSISDRQFFQALASDPWDLITQAEALAAVKTGDVPEAMEGFINALPAGQQFAARMVLSGATTFERSHPLVAAFGTARGMSSTQIDDLWRFAGSL